VVDVVAEFPTEVRGESGEEQDAAQKFVDAGRRCKCLVAGVVAEDEEAGGGATQQ